MKGFCVRLLGVTIALLAVLSLGAFLLYSRLPDLISDKLSKTLKVAVQIEDIHLSFRNITLDHFEIANIPKATLPKAFSAEKISFDAPLTNYIKDAIVIDEISLDQVYLGLEFESPTNLKSNWATLMSPLSADKSSSGSKKTVFIKTLTLTNIQVDLVYKNKKNEVKKLPVIDKIVLTNINTEEGLPMNQIMNSVLGQMLKSVFLKENLKDAVNELLQEPESTVDKLISPFKGLFGG
ncbi:MAG: hypothetical protein V4489_01475 [Chlamydiota bacterium]